MNLAVHLSRKGWNTGLLDIDIHGPSIPAMLALSSSRALQDSKGIHPLLYRSMKVMSIGFLLPDKDDALIWRGPLKMKAIEQMVNHTVWGDLDVLVIDAPPGTGDEALSVCQLIDDIAGMIIVTTPQNISEIDVRKSITFCRALDIPVLGLLNNMASYVCPSCGTSTELFPSGAAQNISNDMQVPILGSLPFDPDIAGSSDQGIPFVEQNVPSANFMKDIMNTIEEKIL